MKSTIKISFLILTWNRYKFLDQCLKALRESINNLDNCEIIVMDNGSTDETAPVLDKYKNDKHFRFVKLNKNYGIKSYKKLFGMVETEYAVIVDDDVLSFPAGLDRIFTDYMVAYPDYGFVGLNVIQNEYTDGAKPPIEHYTEEVRGEKIIERGPTGGWCTCFRRSDYRKVKWRFLFSSISMKVAEDGMLSQLFHKRLKLKTGLIKNAVCFHACGPYYAKQYGHLDREIAKYSASGLDDYVKRYQEFL
jgi:glycosyltransferase involved in cell wall biosynthesis